MFSTDNRWSPGASGAQVPDDARAAYSARWIDQGDGRADIVPDRQGLAFTDANDGGRVIDLLGRHDPRTAVLDRDVSTEVVHDTTALGETFVVWARRAGGYVYVDAWLS